MTALGEGVVEMKTRDGGRGRIGAVPPRLGMSSVGTTIAKALAERRQKC